jgi:hypothetical protein
MMINGAPISYILFYVGIQVAVHIVIVTHLSKAEKVIFKF